MQRESVTAQLIHKHCLSELDQCYEFVFTVAGQEPFAYSPGQFVSAVATDATGRQQTRAYSFSSAPRGSTFELCVNRVRNGFFSNHLADLPSLDVGGSIELHGPHGHFTLREPMTDAIFVGAGAGIAPLRSFTDWLFPFEGMDRSEGKQVWLVQGARRESELYFNAEFTLLERRYSNFHYLPVLAERHEGWYGAVGPVHHQVSRLVEERAERHGLALPFPAVDPATPPGQLSFDFYTYVCGLSPMVTAVREQLATLGLHRRQVVFERYD